MRAVTALGRGLGTATTAEGAELRGFLFSAPRPTVEVIEILRIRVRAQAVA